MIIIFTHCFQVQVFITAVELKCVSFISFLFVVREKKHLKTKVTECLTGNNIITHWAKISLQSSESNMLAI